ncbi:MAG TPA: pyridine nucleotide-disulfide oxidoreductase, partial [Clostridiales bacterium]|nr:pyridine nucleotide-disulfide oxidoreductase [Clostridiales bacterium]
MSKKYTPAHYGDENPNPKLLKLVRKITDRIPAKISGITTKDPEYWGFACIFEDELSHDESERALDLMLGMKVRRKYTYADLLKLAGVTDDASHAAHDALLEKLGVLGMLEYDYGDKYTADGPIPDVPREKENREYWIPLFVPGSAEYTNMNKGLMQRHPELAMFFERMTFLPLEHVTAMVPPGGAGVGMHVIPVEKAISMENESLDIEHISYWLKRYEGHIGASVCSCRYGRKLLDEGCADDPEMWCIGVGDMADYCRETGKGKDITYEEAMEILRRAEDNGFVHQITNIDGEGKIFAICNCNVNICNALRTSQLFNTPNMSRSAYVAHVEKDKCVACGRCVEYCPAGAVKLGQKLCRHDGTEVEYPTQPLPDNNSWGEHMWSEDYRDKNRINTHETGTAPCKATCPAHIAVQGYLKLAAQGKYREALELIKRENPFPAVCGRICNRRCEEACTRGTVDRSVAIDAVKKFIAEQDLSAEHRFVPEIVVASNLGRWKEKVAVIGAGPAGLSCAFYLAQKGYYPTVFEKNERPGGMLTYGIPSYKLEKAIIDAEIDVLREMGVEIRTGIEVGRDVTLDELRAEGYRAFYIAIGCQGGRLPGIPGESAEGTVTAVDFLKEANCGQKKLSGKVVVIGGGNVAIDVARVAARSGADEVHMVCLEAKGEMPASTEEVREAEEDGVRILPGYGPVSVSEENGHASAVTFRRCLSVYNSEKRFAPTFDDADTVTLGADTVIFAIGQSVVLGDLLKGSAVELGRGNYPSADPLTYETAEPDIFVGGDFLTGPKFAIDAIAAGHAAAESVHRYVQHGHMTIGRNRREFHKMDTADISVGTYDTAGRQEPKDAPAGTSAFADTHGTLTEEQVKIETSRCLGCGASIVDPNKCIGCGICTTKCAFDAIHLSRDLPEASRMTVAEKKVGVLLPYAIKRGFRILGNKNNVGKQKKKEAEAAR